MKTEKKKGKGKEGRLDGLLSSFDLLLISKKRKREKERRKMDRKRRRRIDGWTDVSRESSQIGGNSFWSSFRRRR